MNQRILRIAIALPILLLAASPSLADTPNLTPITTTPSQLVKKDCTVTKDIKDFQPDPRRPGEPGVRPRPRPRPRPRRDSDAPIDTDNIILKPDININQQYQDINFAPGR